MYGHKAEDKAPSPQLASVELPASPLRRRSESEISAPDEWGHSSAAIPAPLNPHRPGSVPQQSAPPDGQAAQSQGQHAPPAAAVMDDPDYIPPMPPTPPLAGARPTHHKPITIGGSTQTHTAPPVATSFAIDEGGWQPPNQAAEQRAEPISNAPHASSINPMVQHAAETSFAMGNIPLQKSQSMQRSPGPSQTPGVDVELLNKARQDAEDLRVHLTQVESALAQRDALLAQKDLAIGQTEASLREMTETLELLKNVSDRDEGELKEIRAEQKSLQERLTQADAALAAAKQAHDAEKAELEKKTTEAQAALAAAAAEAADVKRQLEEEKAKAAAPVDIAPGLGSWFKGSLERYKEMIYIESKPLPVAEKLQVFMDFVNSESRLRGIDFPFGPTGQVKGFTQQPPAQPVSPPRKTETPKPEQAPASRPQRPQLSSPGSEGFVMVEPDTEMQYSPGGRPIMRPSLPKSGSVPGGQSTSGQTANQAPVAELGPSPKKPAYQPFRGSSVETTPVSSVTTPPVSAGVAKPTSQPPVETKKPAYKPFAYNKGVEQSATPPSSSQPTPPTATATPEPSQEPIYRPLYKRDSWTTPASPAQGPQKKHGNEETFLDQVSELPNDSVRSPQDETLLPQPLKSKTSAPAPANQATAAGPGAQKATAAASKASPIEHLAALLPPVQMPGSSITSIRLRTLRTALSSLPSDYNFITTLTKNWEAQATTTRSRLEVERRRRQSQLEKRSNELYDDDEIGYGDFDTLEAQAKEEELHRKAKEDADEYDWYGRDVFEPVFRTLQDQIGTLMTIYADAQVLVTEAGAGEKALSQVTSDTDLSSALSLLIQVHGALEERHAEVAKAVQERDRRYKRTQTKPLYAKGDIAGMKHVEKSFELAERKAEVKARVERAERCKRLFKIVETGMERGLGENEDFTADVLVAAENAVKDFTAAATEGDRKQELEELLRRARGVLKDVHTNNATLVKSFEKVDMDLNECEYEVSVASARMKGDPSDFFQRLEREKNIEDGKLREDGEKRVQALDEQLREAEAQLDNVAKKVGGGPAALAAVAENEEERVKRERMQQALEAAKRRNGEI